MVFGPNINERCMSLAQLRNRPTYTQTAAPLRLIRVYSCGLYICNPTKSAQPFSFGETFRSFAFREFFQLRTDMGSGGKIFLFFGGNSTNHTHDGMPDPWDFLYILPTNLIYLIEIKHSCIGKYNSLLNPLWDSKCFAKLSHAQDIRCVTKRQFLSVDVIRI